MTTSCPLLSLQYELNILNSISKQVLKLSPASRGTKQEYVTRF